MTVQPRPVAAPGFLADLARAGPRWCRKDPTAGEEHHPATLGVEVVGAVGDVLIVYQLDPAGSSC